MFLVTTESIAGVQIQMLGIVKGSCVQSKHIGSDISQSLKTIVGGELKSYTKMMDEARTIATNRMIEEATAMGADGIVGIRYTSSAIMQGAAEIMVFGTAVKVY